MKIEYNKIKEVYNKNKGLLAWLIGLTILQSLFMLFIPFWSKIEIEILENRLNVTKYSVSTLFIGIISVILVTRGLLSIIQGIGRVFEARTREQLAIDSDKMLYEKMESLDAGFLQNPKNRRLIYIFFDIGQLPWSLLQFIRMAINILISVAGIIPIIALTNLKVLTVIILVSIVQLIILKRRVKRENAFRLFKEKKTASVNELIFLLRYHFHELLSISGERRIMPKFWKKRRFVRDLEVKQEKISVFYEIFNHLMDNLVLFFTALFMGIEVLNHNLSIGEFTMILMYATTLQLSLSGINHNIGEWFRLKSIFIQLGFFLRMKSRVSLSNINDPKESITGDIVVKNLRFSYPGLFEEEKEYIRHLVNVLKLTNENREVWQSDYELVNEWEKLSLAKNENNEVLKGVDVTFKKGEITALVGRNGSGKTTLMKLLLRNYDPDSGDILIGKKRVKHLSPGYVRHLFALAPQTPFLLESFSVKDNVLIGSPKELKTDVVAEIDKIFNQLDFAKVIDNLPNGIETLIGDESSLSGGESQTLIIARAIIQNRSFLILDEGTNQLDAEKELKILELLNSLKDKMAIIIITHRMTTARKADSIVVLDKGRIIEQGTHNELLNLKGLYKEFWDIQVIN